MMKRILFSLYDFHFQSASIRNIYNCSSLNTLYKSPDRNVNITKYKYEDINKDTSFGLNDLGIVLPTYETHAQLYDGVRYDELPIAHIQSSPNNTIITITDAIGKEILGQTSCGREGFKNCRKSTTVASQATGLSIGQKMYKKGLRNIRVAVRGVGSGRLPSIKGLQIGGLTIVSITDRTHVQHIGPRPRKARKI